MYSKDGVLKDRREMLRVKLKSLAEEARMIRKEECKTNGELRAELHMHRIGIVRSEARATHLAYGLIKGRRLEAIEKPKEPRSPVVWDRVKKMITKYGPTNAEINKEVIDRCNG